MTYILGDVPIRLDTPLLVRKLHRHAPLALRDRDALARALSLDVRTVRSRCSLGEAGQPPRKLAVMLEGWGCTYRLLAGGARQLVAFHLPGDVCDLHALLGPRPGTIIEVTGGARLARLSRETVAALTAAHPALSRALWCEARTAGAIEREWLVTIARRGARERVAHMLSELCARADQVGQLVGGALAVPISQADVAEACGLTPAHCNRVLRSLREGGLVSWSAHLLRVPDRAALMAAGGFTGDYLAAPAGPLPQPGLAFQVA